MPITLFGNETEPRILIHTSPDYPAAGSIWAFTLLIAHSEPNEVEVFAPNFTGPLLLEQVIKGPRFFNPSTGQLSVSNPTGTAENNEPLLPVSPSFFERWTIMEYRFMLNSPGTISFDAFTVVTPHGQITTDPFDLHVLRSQNSAEILTYRLVWEGIPLSLKVGESAVFTLRCGGWNAASLLPDAGLFLPPVPPGHILESIPLTPAEKSAGIVLKLRLIPLETSPFVIESRRVSYNANFEIPSLRIAVGRSAGNAAGSNEAAPEQNIVAAPFPPLETARRNNSDLFQKHRGECETIYASARNLWEAGRMANALATLRQNERDHPAGAFFAALRRNAEEALGFAGTNDEKRSWLPFFRNKSRSAVIKETVVRRIPDMAGREIARFREGQPVLLAERPNGAWLRVVANDDNRISGWVPEDSIIFY
ncbi:MAG: hypothetical protein LBI06_07795 [Treponema sp.]|nr:hypothetical protein [Treponema sp.]